MTGPRVPMLPRLYSALPERAVFGHRGTPVKAPENTLPSFQGAVDLGVHGLEFDVRLTRDGEVVVIHDADLLRTTGRAGAVAEMSWDRMREHDAGATFTPDRGATYPFRERGVRVPRLIDVLAAFPTTAMIIEVKVIEAASAVRRILLEVDALDRCMVGAFRHKTLLAFNGSGIARSASTREVAQLYLPALLGRRYARLPFQALSLPPVHRGIPVPLGALSRAVAPAGAPVLAWTINDVEGARTCWQRGVRAVLSDDPATILPAR
ncbi:MAG: hypothetical protein H7066_11565 [Cytophagaceae bacterium]|nr:hypothetical protein [Gemmatimonadaceae bacterium]